jgi:hypothetical protein
MEWIEPIIAILFYPFVIIALLSSLIAAVDGKVAIPDTRFTRFLAHKGWLLFIVPLLFLKTGQFARGEASILPWAVFYELDFITYSVADKIFEVISRLTTDLWLFWIPSNLIIESHEEKDSDKRLMLRIINALVGILIVSPDTPAWDFLGWITQGNSGAPPPY